VPSWETNGTWDYFNPDDPACTAGEDQLRAATYERMRNARSFVALTVPRDSDGTVCDVGAVLEPDITHDGADRQALMHSMAELTARMWFEYCDGNPYEVMVMCDIFMRNYRGAMFTVLEEKGWM